MSSHHTNATVLSSHKRTFQLSGSDSYPRRITRGSTGVFMGRKKIAKNDLTYQLESLRALRGDRSTNVNWPLQHQI